MFCKLLLSSLIFEKIYFLETAPSVAIVILNWNGKHYLEQFLPSVFATSYSNCRLVVADNASEDGSVAFLHQNFPNVELIQIEKNLGFAGGYNEALKHVSADYYVLLNSDVEVTPAWLNPIIELLEKEPAHGACQPKILSYKHRELFEYAGAGGGWLDVYGYPFARGRIFDICEEDKGQYNTTEEVFWATGAAMVIRSHVFHELHGFDEYFFAHQEEIDLCWRMKLAGYKVFCCTESVVYHVGGGTLPRGNSRKTLLNFRNNQIMISKNMSWAEKWWKIPFRLFLDQVSAWKGLFGGDGGYFIAIMNAHLAFAYWMVFGNKKWKPKRRIQMKHLTGVYTGNIVWQHFARKRKFFREIVKDKEDGHARLFIQD